MKKKPSTQRAQRSAEDYMRRFEREVLPQIKGSAITLAIASDEPSAKQCMELGAALLFDKPIIVVLQPGQKIPTNLRRCASAIVEGDVDDPSTKDRLQAAIQSALKEDRRVI